ncbi:MAG TPA: hypothetical protein VJ617_00065 [Arthrobacter sp.]|nr:hypothetical protein [Arthrobacter sp.]
MEHMTTSRWDIGTYDLLISKDTDGKPGDLMVVVFAHPVDIDDTEADHDAPILAHVDVLRREYDQEVPAHLFGVASIGLRGLIQPEDIEKLFGLQLGLRVMLALWQGIDRDFRGVDMDHRPWRTPNEEAVFPLMQRVHALLMDLRNRAGFTTP